MRTPYTQLYLHCVWVTWDRLPLITPAIEQPLYAEILHKCKELKCEPVTIGGMPDHIHLLVQLHATVTIADLFHDIKGASSHLITQKVMPEAFSKWQGAYGAFTVSKEGVPAVTAYILHQKEHHTQSKLWEDFERTLTEEI
jgi:putative transposase